MSFEKTDREYYGKIGYEDNIFHLLLSVGHISSRIFDAPSSEWQKNAMNYYFAIQCLESVVAPYLGEDYKEKVDEIIKTTNKEYHKEHDSSSHPLIRKSRFQEVLLTIRISNAILKEIILRLKDIGLLIPQQYRVSYGEEETDEINRR